ncbi:hypothetical protein CARUB_v10016490mg [Capsella rubella]|uniref:Uncharacterized protein n=1 Tax=Capsella rubella TaxID=81985 RepID=R0HTJ3_9BRAS|nr:hypothetical protein CARUB_v10016490mg [Capsella rubella]
MLLLCSSQHCLHLLLLWHLAFSSKPKTSTFHRVYRFFFFFKIVFACLFDRHELHVIVSNIIWTTIIVFL